MPNAIDTAIRMNANGEPVAARYANASVMGVTLGFVLLASFVFAGRGIGASGAFAHVTGSVMDLVRPGFLASRPTLADRLPSGVDLWSDWIMWQIAGVCIGAALSAKLAGRWGRDSAAERTESHTSTSLAGGVLMGVGARFAYGCTSGLALSGG
ncbi:MAG: YeeE/YedE thiosulfate transporter family protein, partial [Gemmatimonadaceae bacterium]